MSGLEKQLKKHGVPKRIQVRCDKCGKKIYDSDKREPLSYYPSYIETLILVYAKKHHNKTGHASISVDIEKQPTVSDTEVNVTVTVNE